MIKRASSILEVIIAIGILTFAGATIVVMSLGSLTSTSRGENNLKAIALAQEGLEAARAIRDYDWNNLTIGTHGLTDSNNYWEFTGTSDSTGVYTRTIEVSDIDASTKLVVASITWDVVPGLPTTRSMSTHFTDWSGEATWLQTSQADFDLGTTNSTVTSASGDGAVELASLGDWSSATVLTSYNLDGDGDVRSVWVENNLLYIISKNDGADQEFKVFDISDIANANLIPIASTELSANTNDIFISNGYAFITTENTSEEIMIVRLSDYQKVNSIDIPAGTKAYGIEIVNNIAYVGTAKSGSEGEFFAYDVSDPEASITTPLANIEIGHRVSAVTISGGYAYLGTDHDSKELSIVRLSDYQEVNSLNLDGSEDMRAVIADGNTLYMGRRGDDDINELYKLDISSPEGTITILNEINLDGDDIKDMFKYGRKIYAVTDNGNKEIAIFDLDTNTLETQIDINSSTIADGVWVDGIYIYAGTRNNTDTLQVIQGGVGPNASYVTSGTFTSSAFDTGTTSPTYGALSWTLSGSGSVRIQIRTADTEANLSSATWVDHSTSGAAIQTAPGAQTQWIQYQATLSENGTLTPVLEDVSITY